MKDIYVIHRLGGPCRENCARGLGYRPRPQAEGRTQADFFTFKNEICGVKKNPGEILVSYDVSSLFTNIKIKMLQCLSNDNLEILAARCKRPSRPCLLAASLRTVPTISKIFLPRFMITQKMLILTSVTEIQKEIWG